VKIPTFEKLVRAALAEDAPKGDLTSRWTVPGAAQAQARLIARQPGVAAGLPLFARCFSLVDSRCKTRLNIQDGVKFKADAILAEVQGPARALLLAERVALNFLQRLSGIASLTANYVEELGSSQTKILDTRIHVFPNKQGVFIPLTLKGIKALDLPTLIGLFAGAQNLCKQLLAIPVPPRLYFQGTRLIP